MFNFIYIYDLSNFSAAAPTFSVSWSQTDSFSMTELVLGDSSCLQTALRAAMLLWVIKPDWNMFDLDGAAMQSG